MRAFLKKCSKLISLMLTVALIMCAVPVGTYATELQNFFEAEDVQPAEDAETTWTVAEDKNASGGKVATGTKGVSFIMTDIVESNRIIMKAAGVNSGSASVSIKEEDGTWRKLGSLSFATTQNTSMQYGNEVQLKGVYIPEGSTIKVTPQVEMNIDYFRFSSEALNDEAALDRNQLIAKNGMLSGGAAIVEQIMSTVGTAVELTMSGDSVTFTVPDGISDDQYNSFNIRYYAESDSALTITVDTESASKNIDISACEYGQFSVCNYFDTVQLTAGTTISVVLQSGSVVIDMLTLTQVLISDQPAEIVMPTKADERSNTSLDGVWQATKTDGVKPASTVSVPEGDYDYTAPVPGLWDLATPDLGDYSEQNMWYKRTVIMPDDYTADSGYTVQLEILKAQYGRSIYINGRFVEHYTWNYSASYTDITQYLHAGENTIEIMLGYYGSFYNDNIKPAAATDPERTEYRPGIPDSVTVIVNRAPHIDTVQTAADIDNGTVQVRARLDNKSSTSVTTDVSVKIYELGTVTSGVSSKRQLVGSHTLKDITVAAGSEYQVDIDKITLSGFDIDTKAWCPENPYLYEIEIKTEGDTLSRRFGMRTFYYDPETKEPMLNGKIYRLLGTNVVINRFYEDPAHSDYAWDEQWVRQLYSTFRDTNWDVIRTHVGPVPSFWYDIADETGMMIVDEYAIFTDWWFTYDSILPEMHAIIDEKQTHASIIYWDVQNEKADQTRTGDVISTLFEEGYDISNRNIDNGWAAPYDENQPVEFHPYPFWGVTTLSEFVTLNTLDNTVPTNGGNNSGTIVNPKVINEYAEMWLDRWGDPTSISADNYASFMPDATREERLQFYAEFVAKCTEFWRAGRNVAAVQYFSGLTYSKPNAEGATGDLLLPDISTPQIRPETQEIVKDSFARLGIAIERYDVYTAPGLDFVFPVTLINDLNTAVEDLSVTFMVTCNGRLLAKENAIYDLAAVGDADGGDLVTKNFEFVTPTNLSNGDELIVTASYTLNGEEVTSLRRIICRGFKDSSQQTPVDNVCSIGKTAEASSIAAGAAGSVVNGLKDTFNLGDKVTVFAKIACSNANNGKKASVSVGDVKIEVSCSGGGTNPVCTVYVKNVAVGSVSLTASDEWFLNSGANITVAIDTQAKQIDLTLLNVKSNETFTGSFTFEDDISFDDANASVSVTGNYVNNAWRVNALKVYNTENADDVVDILPVTNTSIWTGKTDRFNSSGLYMSAADGNTYTATVKINDCCGYWQSDANDSEYITIDLGAATKLTRVKLFWGENYGSEYKIQVSSDGVDYTDAVSVTDGTGGNVSLVLPDNTIARFIRMQGVKSATSNGYSLYEFEIYSKYNNAVVYSTGKPATTSSIEAWWGAASNATDGLEDSDHRWSANASHEDWLMIDLGIEKEIFKVELMWTSYSYGKEYKIQVSNDGETFTDVLHITDGTGGTSAFDMPVGTYGRYVRMQGIEYGGYGYSLFEFKIYCEQAEGLLYSTGKLATASSIEAWWGAAGNVTDSVIDSYHRWSANASPEDWITVDLGVVKEIAMVELMWTTYAYAGEFKLQVSNDGETFTDVLHITGGGGGTSVYEFPAGVNARYVRMQGIAYGSLSGYSLYEFNVYVVVPEITAIFESVSLDKSEMILEFGSDTRSAYGQLLASTQPLNATNISELSWSSDAPEVASVDSKGKVSAVSCGTANITYTVVTDEDVTYTAQCTVTVVGVHSVTFDLAEGCVVQAVDGFTSSVKEGGDYSFTVAICEGYVKNDDFAVYANGVALTELNGVYTINNITQNQVITVSGIDTEEIVLGDVNCDGIVDSSDVLELEQVMLGIIPADSGMVKNVDFNSNNVIDPSDLLALKLKTLGL